MNAEMKRQIDTMIDLLGSFTSVCKITALKDDGKIDRQENRAIKAIDRATERYIEALKEIKI